MNLAPTAPRFGKLDTTPLRQADIPRSLIPVADAIANGFEKRLETDTNFARAIAQAEKDGLDVEVNGSFLQNHSSYQSTLDVMAYFIDRATGERPNVTCSTGAGLSSIEAKESTEADVTRIIGRILSNLSDGFWRVPNAMKVKQP
jgi:aspartate/tyrosine/aromatic aminotransferase